MCIYLYIYIHLCTFIALINRKPQKSRSDFFCPPKNTPWGLWTQNHGKKQNCVDIFQKFSPTKKCLEVYDHRMKMTYLALKWTSKASAHQRSGRAGRTMEGTVVRLYLGRGVQVTGCHPTILPWKIRPNSVACTPTPSPPKKMEVSSIFKHLFCKLIMPNIKGGETYIWFWGLNSPQKNRGKLKV